MNSFNLRPALLVVALLFMSITITSAQSSNDKANPYPKFVHTGKPDVDKKNHEKAVKEWQEKEAKRKNQVNQDRNQLNATPSSNGAITKQQLVEQKRVDRGINKTTYNEGKVLRSKKIVNQPNAPIYNRTGNKKFDDAQYDKKKTEWVANHPDEHKRALSNKKSNLKRNAPAVAK